MGGRKAALDEGKVGTGVDWVGELSAATEGGSLPLLTQAVGIAANAVVEGLCDDPIVRAIVTCVTLHHQTHLDWTKQTTNTLMFQFPDYLNIYI